MKVALAVFVLSFGIVLGDQFPELDFYSFLVHDLDGNPVKLEEYRGTVSLVVNVASQCGYTDSHYKSLKRMQDILGFSKRFQVLAFPCNQFGEQEPGTNEDIKNFVTENYDVDFLVFSKIDVIGDSAHPAFRNVVAQSSIHPEWNFYKYLIDTKGRVIKAWSTKVSVDDIFRDVQKAVEQAEKENPFIFEIKEEVFDENDVIESEKLEKPEAVPAPEIPVLPLESGNVKDEL